MSHIVGLGGVETWTENEGKYIIFHINGELFKIQTITIDDVESYLGDAAACTLKPARPEVWAILCWFKECNKISRMFNPNKIAQRLWCLHAQSLFTPEFLACFARALSHDCSQSRVVKQTKPGVETCRNLPSLLSPWSHIQEAKADMAAASSRLSRILMNFVLSSLWLFAIIRSCSNHLNEISPNRCAIVKQ